MDRRSKVLLPCLRPRDLDLSQNHRDILFRKYIRQKLRFPSYLEHKLPPKPLDGDEFIEQVMGELEDLA